MNGQRLINQVHFLLYSDHQIATRRTVALTGSVSLSPSQPLTTLPVPSLIPEFPT